jgi:hypothetical protein
MDEYSIFAHRGLWSSDVAQNSHEALKRASALGFGVETDIRTYDSRLILSHDSSTRETFHEEAELINFQSRFALNIKEDGLQRHMKDLIEWMLLTKSFVFDGSIPEMRKYRSLGIPSALRMSEYEKELPWNSDVVWLDSFTHDWWLSEQLHKSIMGVSEFIVVSPELHGRDHREVWDYLKKNTLKGDIRYSICTDKPLEFEMW